MLRWIAGYSLWGLSIWVLLIPFFPLIEETFKAVMAAVVFAVTFHPRAVSDIVNQDWSWFEVARAVGGYVAVFMAAALLPFLAVDRALAYLGKRHLASFLMVVGAVAVGAAIVCTVGGEASPAEKLRNFLSVLGLLAIPNLVGVTLFWSVAARGALGRKLSKI